MKINKYICIMYIYKIKRSRKALSFDVNVASPCTRDKHVTRGPHTVLATDSN